MNKISLLSVYIAQVPPLILWLVGIGVALATLRKHPRRSAFTLIALGLLLLENVATTGTSIAVPFLFARHNIEPATVGNILLAVNITSVLLKVVAWALLLITIFSLRERQA